MLAELARTAQAFDLGHRVVTPAWQTATSPVVINQLIN